MPSYLAHIYARIYIYYVYTHEYVHLHMHIYICINGAVIHKTLIRRSYDRTAVCELSARSCARAVHAYSHTHTQHAPTSPIFRSHIASSLHLIKVQNAFFTAKEARSARYRLEGGGGREGGTEAADIFRVARF